jgi:hypothetical protein
MLLILGAAIISLSASSLGLIYAF